MVVLIYHLKKEMQLFYKEEDSMGLSENKKQEIYFKNIDFGGQVLQLDKFDLNNLVYDSSKDFLNPRKDKKGKRRKYKKRRKLGSAVPRIQ